MRFEFAGLLLSGTMQKIHMSICHRERSALARYRMDGSGNPLTLRKYISAVTRYIEYIRDGGLVVRVALAAASRYHVQYYVFAQRCPAI